MIKQITCLHRLPGLSMEEFQDHWLGRHAGLVASERRVRRYVQYHRIANDPVYEALSQAESAEVEPYDGFSVTWWDDIADISQSKLARDDEHYFIDTARSLVCLTEERVVVEPEGTLPYVLFECLRKRADIDRATFSDIWWEHRAIGQQANGLGLLMGYIQNCTLPEDDARAAAIGGNGPEAWDGIVAAYFESIAKLKALLSSPLASEESFEDERRFMDHSQGSYAVTRRHVIKDVIR